MRTHLPIADSTAVRRRVGALARQHRTALLTCATLDLAAAAASLVPPRLLGHLVGGVDHGLTDDDITRTAVALTAVVLLAAVLRRWARLRSFVLGEQVLAQVREEFVEGVLALPLGVVERAGTGDLLSRTTADVAALTKTVRQGFPEVTVAVITALATLVAMLLAAPVPAAAGVVVTVPVVAVVTRWYLRRAPAGYLAERQAASDVTARVAETIEAGGTVEALGRQQQRVALAEQDLGRAWEGERYTLSLRCVFYPACETAYVLPVATCLMVGGLLAIGGHLSLAQVTAVTLYAQLLVDPVDRLLNWLDEVQIGSTSFARLLGVTQVDDDRTASGQVPHGEQLVADGVHFAYAPGRPVLEGIDLTLQPGERLAIVGPSGAGKSTLARLLAGVHPPGSGSVTVGGAPLTGLPLAQLRREVSLVTQEHHVFSATLAENLRLALPAATDAQLREALAAVDWTGCAIDQQVGAGGLALTPPEAQQVALARLVLADPHTLVLDEATALLDPRAARHLERSLSAVLTGRTVVAIAHRLHTASDADRVAVVEQGRVLELGTHAELLASNGSYADLWRSWHG